MRIRNLNSKPTVFTGNPLMLTRWQTRYGNGDGCFTVNTGNNTGNNTGGTEFSSAKTSFDIIGNPDIQVQPTDVAPWITGLPDGQVCFLCDVEPLLDINVMMQAHGQIDKNKNFNVQSGIVKASGVPGSRIVVSAVCRHQLDNRNCATVRFASDAETNTDVARVWGVAIVTGEEKEIMDLLNVGAFTALTAPYAAVPSGGGVFLLAIGVLTGGWPHENTESMAGPALRKQDRQLEPHSRSCHHHAGRLALEIRHTKGLVVNPDEKSGLHDAGVQPARLTGLPSSGESDHTAPGGWDARHGHHAGIGAECRRHCVFCGCGDHGARVVRRRSGRVADTAGDGSARLRSRHRTLLNDGLGVAA